MSHQPDVPQTPFPPPAPSAFPIPMVSVRDEPKWEYRCLVRNLRTEEAPKDAELNALGAEGWELGGMFLDSPLLHLYFKRPVW